MEVEEKIPKKEEGITRLTSSLASSQSQKTLEEKKEYIPCLYMPYDNGARKLAIYFHGNAEDIGLAFDMLY